MLLNIKKNLSLMLEVMNGVDPLPPFFLHCMTRINEYDIIIRNTTLPENYNEFVYCNSTNSVSVECHFT